jgi:hypothetical protein
LTITHACLGGFTDLPVLCEHAPKAPRLPTFAFPLNTRMKDAQ